MKYSDAKDPNRIKEEDIFLNFITFIELIEEKKIETEFYDPSSKSMALKQLGQQDILQFLTGSRFLPYLKDEIDITCQFKHVSVDEFEKYGPSYQVSTCKRIIKFPVIKKYIEESSFSKAFIDDIGNSPGFTLGWNKFQGNFTWKQFF